MKKKIKNKINPKPQFLTYFYLHYFRIVEQLLLTTTMPSSNFSPKSIPDLAGRIYLVTGGNAGM